ncbi:MAG: hypothetical protein ABL982_14550 [Vicinamibacterales bacterium]
MRASWRSRVADARLASPNATWLWGGSTWTQLQPATPARPTFSPVMVFDETRHRMTLFDGQDTWVLLPP